MKSMKIACHCQNLQLELDWEPQQFQARACDCGFCSRHGALWTADPDAQLIIQIREPKQVKAYVFATETAQFQICQICGCVPYVSTVIDKQMYALVNLRCWSDFELTRIQIQAVSYLGEDRKARLARRSARWISKIQMLCA
jgi:hypothetical protein